MQEPSPEDNAPMPSDLTPSGPPSDLPPTAPLFEATLYPHRSLPREGFWILMAAVAAVSFTMGLICAAAGAWPVFGFFGLDVALLYWAFRANYRDGQLLEHVRLTREELTIRRIHPNGQVEDWRLQPYWLNVDAVPTQEEIGAPLAEVRLSSHGRSLAIGRFLTDDERDAFSAELRAALARCRSLPETP